MKSFPILKSAFSMLLAFLIVLTLGVPSNGGNTNEYKDISIDIRLDKAIFNVGFPIEVTTIVRNEGRKIINMSQPEMMMPTLDFEIVTPESYRLHYVGSYLWHIPHVLSLKPKSSFIIKVNITDDRYNFGNINITNYNFSREGIYSIRAICRSNSSWHGGSNTSISNFVVYSDVKQFIITSYPSATPQIQIPGDVITFAATFSAVAVCLSCIAICLSLYAFYRGRRK